MNEAEFLDRLREAFAIEADEHFRTMSKCLTDLEQLDGEGRHQVIELIFREAHSLKGAARAINRGDIEALCQSLESMFSVWKKEARRATVQQFDLAAQAVDLLAEMLASDDERAWHDGPVAAVIDAIKAQASMKPFTPPVVAPLPADAVGDLDAVVTGHGTERSPVNGRHGRGNGLRNRGRIRKTRRRIHRPWPLPCFRRPFRHCPRRSPRGSPRSRPAVHRPANRPHPRRRTHHRMRFPQAATDTAFRPGGVRQRVAMIRKRHEPHRWHPPHRRSQPPGETEEPRNRTARRERAAGRRRWSAPAPQCEA